MKHKLYIFLRKDWVYQNFPTLESALEFVLNEKIMSRKGKNSNFEIKLKPIFVASDLKATYDISGAPYGGL